MTPGIVRSIVAVIAVVMLGSVAPPDPTLAAPLTSRSANTDPQQVLVPGQPALRATVDPLLEPAMTLLYSLGQTGEMYSSSLPEMKTRVTSGALPSGMHGRFDPASDTVTINQSFVGTETVGAVAATLAHELLHAISHWAVPDKGCVEGEVDALRYQASAWRAILQQGYQPRGTELERFHSEVLRVALEFGEPGLYKAVVDNKDYQHQCSLFVPR